MTGLSALIRRDIKLYFKDKGLFFSSLIMPLVLLALYATFLKNVYTDSFRSALAAAGASVPDKLLNGCVGDQLVSSLLAVSCVTVAFCSNLLMIRDKTSGARRDLTVSPVRPGVIGLGYYLATLCSTLIVTLAAAAAVCLGYLALVGWYLSAADAAMLLLDVFLLTMFGTALSSVVNCLLSTDGQASAVGTIVSAGYGFLCGAYMPLSSFSEGLRKVLGFLPGTYGTSLLHNHTLRGVFAEMRSIGFPAEVVELIRDSVDCNLYFFGKSVSIGAMYAVMAGAVALLVAVYVAESFVQAKRKK